jgi:hypothetical protein
MYKYILVHPDEDGNTTTFIESSEVEDIKMFMENYGIDELLDKIPDNKDPQYWEEGKAMLLEIEIKKIKPVKIVEKYEIE